MSKYIIINKVVCSVQKKITNCFQLCLLFLLTKIVNLNKVKIKQRLDESFISFFVLVRF